jgi:hypothetical protein
VALETDERDGHRDLRAAVVRGARGIVCRSGRWPRIDLGVDVVEVAGPLEPFRRLAASWRRQFRLPVAS